MLPEYRYVNYILQYPFKSFYNKRLKNYFKRQARESKALNLALEEVAEYIGQTVEMIYQRFRSEDDDQEMKRIFHDDNQAGLTEDDVKNFYRGSQRYIIELPLWNAESHRSQMLGKIITFYTKKFGVKTVLDAGGGAGDLSMELSGRNLHVSYMDISEPLFKFSAWRFKRRNLEIPMYKDLSEIHETFNCIVTFDVFEHIKNLPDFIQQLSTLLDSGGILIFSGAFSGGGLHLRENEKYNDLKEMNEVLKTAKLRFYDRFAQYFIYQKS